MANCVICSSLAAGFLCSKCEDDPFRVEDLRNILAREKRTTDLKETYARTYPSLKNLNSPVFWDEIFRLRGVEEMESPMTRDRVEEVVEIIKDKEGRMLDVGLGLGFVEKSLLRLNKKDLTFYGIDISKFAIAKARKKLAGKFTRGSILQIPFASEYFDLVLSLEILEHIPPFQTFKALDELWRVLKKRGLVIVSVPLNEGLEAMCKRGLNPNGHVRVYTAELIRAELEIAKFRILEEKYFYAFKNLYSLKDFLQKTLLKNRWQPNDLLLVAQKP